MAALALGGLGIALYLGIVKLTGGNPACGVLHGCDTVNQSEYASILGIPTGLFGAAASAAMLAGALVWWLRADRRALLLTYLISLLSLPFLAWFTYLELFVIEAICIWCAGYAIVVSATWLVAMWVLWRDGKPEA
ncbi:MAG: vitamin K epoxide reductase family protein [Chloroflexota bacterium]|nr:vitamin K epoxide reductase family protein [Chloroflexota bacterium]